jgi:hypothetical protein
MCAGDIWSDRSSLRPFLNVHRTNAATVTKDTHMTLNQKRTAKTARRQRRAARNLIALTITHHLISPSLKPAALKAPLAKFAKLSTRKAS